MKQIQLTQGKFALCDDNDFEWLNEFNWQYRGGYAARYAGTGRANHTIIFMHNEIAQPPAGLQTDHINLDKLDNRRANLRNGTRSQNLGNVRSKGGSSQYKGVWYVRRAGKWAAMIQVDKRRVWLGQFAAEIDAAKAYDAAARIHFGEFARCNFPLESDKDA